MDDVRIGALVRALRIRAGMRQVDLARAAGVSQSLISSIECGHLETTTVATLRRVFAALGARFDGQVLWRGADLDRLLDARHAALVEASVRTLRRLDWDTVVEATYSIYGERGSIDVLAGMHETRAVVVEEVKTDIPRLEEMLRKLDEKARLVRDQIAFDRFGWRPLAVGRILVLPDTDRARRLIASHEDILASAFPVRGPAVRRWLRKPSGTMSGIVFVADTTMGGANARRVGVHRVRVRRQGPDKGESGVIAGSVDIRTANGNAAETARLDDRPG